METPWPARKATILLVDDASAQLDCLPVRLQDECAHEVVVVRDAAAASQQLREDLPDLLLLFGPLDHPAQGLVEQLELLLPAGDHVPVMIVTPDDDPERRALFLELGVTDVLVEPVSDTEVCHRARNHLAIRLVVTMLKHSAHGLRQQLALRDAELEYRAFEQLDQLQLALAVRDPASAQRARRIGVAAQMLASASGSSPDVAGRLRQAAPLHDVGMLGIADDVLNKRGPLTATEQQSLEHHTLIGARLLGASHTPLLELAASIALLHHERWDGSGYPYGLVGERIPKAARIVAVVDLFDTLTNPRPDRPAWSTDRATEELRRVAGTRLDPALVQTFVSDCAPALRNELAMHADQRPEWSVDLVGNGVAG